MAEFEVNVVKVDDVIEHPNADRLTIVKIGGYNCIANKKEDGSWRYQAGDLAVYIPEQSVIPEWLLQKMEFWKDGKGMLAGSRGDRVKAIKLRGIFSQGLLLPVEHSNLYHQFAANGPGIPNSEGIFIAVEVGLDVAEFLGIHKYEPPIPSSMSGEVYNASGKTLNFDIENFKKYPDVLQEGEDVVITEKLHGTFCCWGIYQNNITFIKNNKEENVWEKIVTSKGLSSRGLAFKFNEPNLKNNLYLQTLQKTEIKGSGDILTRLQKYWPNNEPVYILGEIFGNGVQDLKYGQTGKAFRVFDIYVGEPTRGRYLNFEELQELCQIIKLDWVPVLYVGPFSLDKIEEHKNGMDKIAGANIREGIVIKPVIERQEDDLGRVCLKSLSEKYLLRKNGTEHN